MCYKIANITKLIISKQGESVNTLVVTLGNTVCGRWNASLSKAHAPKR